MTEQLKVQFHKLNKYGGGKWSLSRTQFIFYMKHQGAANPLNLLHNSRSNRAPQPHLAADSYVKMDHQEGREHTLIPASM